MSGSNGRARGGLSRRRFAMLAAGAALAGAWPTAAAAHGDGKRSLRFHHLHTGEDVAIDYWRDGHYLKEPLGRINHLLRDFRTGDVHPIDVRLLDLLHRVARRFGSREPFQVISGYRSPATNAKLRKTNGGVAKKSLHMQGMAVDVRLPGVRLGALRQAALELRQGGVGYYPKSDFVHLDIGRVRRW